MEDIEAVYRQYAKPVYGYLLGLCGNANDAEELTAETFYRAVSSIHRFKGECALLSWLCQIAKHAWYQELERRRKKGCAPLDVAETLSDPAPTPPQALESGQQKMDLYRSIRALPQPMREVMYLRLRGDLSFREIGELLEKSENWARVTYYRGKEKVKEESLEAPNPEGTAT